MQVCVTHNPRSRSPTRFQTEKVAEEIKMWENAKIGLVEMDEDRNVKDRV